MRLVSVNDLKPNMQLARSVYMNGCEYLRAGLRDFTRYGKSLEKLGIYYVYVADNDSRGINVPDVVSEKTREECKLALSQTFEDFLKRGELDLERVAYPVHCIMKDIMANRNVQLSLMDISVTDEYTYGHSVSTAVYSAMIGIQMGYNESQMNDLVTAAILHDIGKIKLNGSILYKQGRLNEREFDYVKQHTTLGYDLLKNVKNLPEAVKIVALNHHERLDKSGYPNGIGGKEIDQFSRIVAVADVYEALTSTRAYRDKWRLNEAAEYLTNRAGSEFDSECVSKLLKKVALFPNGSQVTLSNGNVGIVKEQNEGLPHCPVIRVYEENGKHIVPRDLNLAEIRSVSIIEMQ